MSSGKNVRLVDIAKVLGYTVNTVSRALRDKPDIGYDTKLKVREVANQMGYIPNSIASSLRSGSTNTVAIVFDNMVNPYFMIMADKIHRELESLGYATMIFAAHNIKFEIDSLNPLISRKVDGIFTFLEPSSEVIEICNHNKIPIILIGRKNEKLNVDSVSTDDFLGGFEVGNLLISKNAKNIGYIGAPKDIECSVRRLNGLISSLMKNGVNFDDDNLRFMKGVSFLEDLEYLLNKRVDSIFFFNDMMALEAITYLQNKGYKVPDDIKVVGFDDIQSEFFIPVTLTTISSNKNDIVVAAVNILIDKIQNQETNKKFQHIDFDVKIKLGNTT